MNIFVYDIAFQAPSLRFQISVREGKNDKFTAKVPYL